MWYPHIGAASISDCVSSTKCLSQLHLPSQSLNSQQLPSHCPLGSIPMSYDYHKSQLANHCTVVVHLRRTKFCRHNSKLAYTCTYIPSLYLGAGDNGSIVPFGLGSFSNRTSLNNYNLREYLLRVPLDSFFFLAFPTF